MLKTFFNYCGGKSRLVSTLFQTLPLPFGDYYEPFLGSGAFALALASCNDFEDRKAYLSDVDAFVVHTWKVIQDDYLSLLGMLPRGYIEKTQHAQWLAVLNSLEAHTRVEIAAAYIGLRTYSFGSLIKYSRKQEKWQASLSKSETWKGGIRRASIWEGHHLLKKNVLIAGHSYDKIQPKAGDFVFLDPPYYTSDNSVYGDQRPVYPDLIEFCHHLTQSGVHWVMTNTNHDVFRKAFDEKNIIDLGKKTNWFALSEKKRQRPRYDEIMILSPACLEAWTESTAPVPLPLLQLMEGTTLLTPRVLLQNCRNPDVQQRDHLFEKMINS
jgi:DNA adenine methylase